MNSCSSSFRTSFRILESSCSSLSSRCNGRGRKKVLTSRHLWRLSFWAMYHPPRTAGLGQNKSINDNESYVPKALNPPRLMTCPSPPPPSHHSPPPPPPAPKLQLGASGLSYIASKLSLHPSIKARIPSAARFPFAGRIRHINRESRSACTPHFPLSRKYFPFSALRKVNISS